MAENDTRVVTYDRETLVTLLQQKLAAQQADRQAKLAAQEAQNKAALDQITEAATDFPEFLVWMADQLRYSFGVRPGTDDFPLKMKEMYGDRQARQDDYDPDADLNRLIRVYENAADAQVKIEVGSDLYRYL